MNKINYATRVVRALEFAIDSIEYDVKNKKAGQEALPHLAVLRKLRDFVLTLMQQDFT